MAGSLQHVALEAHENNALCLAEDAVTAEENNGAAVLQHICHALDGRAYACSETSKLVSCAHCDEVEMMIACSVVVARTVHFLGQSLNRSAIQFAALWGAENEQAELMDRVGWPVECRMMIGCVVAR
jgi:hypothetical protein